MEGDRGTLDRIFDGEAHGPNRVVFLRERSEFEAQQGRLDSADRLDLQASRLPSDSEDISWALVYSARQNAEAGKVVQARKTQDQALQSKLDRNQRMVLALSLVRSGRIEEAERLANEVSQEAPLDTIVQKYLVPTVRAAVKLQQHDPAAAIDLSAGPSSTISPSPIRSIISTRPTSAAWPTWSQAMADQPRASSKN